MQNRMIGKLSLATAIVVAMLTGFTQTAEAAEEFVVEFRLTKWKTVHFNDEKKADEYMKTFEKLGCKAEKKVHGNHWDVAYTCPKWRSISLKDHDEAHQWEKWLKDIGFETKHDH